MTAFPAAAGTYLIDYDDSVAPLPLIGWVHTTGLNVSPLVLGHPGPLVSGEGFLLHTGQVYDPWSSTLHDDADDWRNTLTENTVFRPGSALPMFAVPSAVAPAAIPEVPTAPGARTQPQPKTPVPAGALVWGTKTFKSKSFWNFKTATGEEIIFVVEAENPVPKNATKITREEFYAKRKAGVIEKAGRPDDEPELPLTETKSPAPADDDDDDLV